MAHHYQCQGLRLSIQMYIYNIMYNTETRKGGGGRKGIEGMEGVQYKYIRGVVHVCA